MFFGIFSGTAQGALFFGGGWVISPWACLGVGLWHLSGTNNDGCLSFLNKKNVVKEGRIKTSKIFEFTLYGQGVLDLSLSGFGQDAIGEVHIVSPG